MRKLKLAIEDLEVTSFDTDRKAEPTGTVDAFNYPSGKNSCNPPETCNQCVSYDIYGPTCEASCRSCDVSCFPFPC